jgi:hypothetical protein
VNLGSFAAQIVTNDGSRQVLIGDHAMLNNVTDIDENMPIISH